MRQRTNITTHQKKCPHYPENTIEKNQGPTLLRFEKTTSLSRKQDGENTKKNDGEKPQENPM